MSCALLENSKAQYNIRINTVKSIMMPLPMQNESNITIARTEVLPTQSHFNIPLKRPNDIPLIVDSTSLSSSSSSVSLPKKPLLQYPSNQRYPIQHSRRQIFWNTANISTETRFLLDVQANQAFGFGTDGRERLASKHPELIRYLPDGQDRDWLVQQKIIPEQNRNSRFLFLIYDEVMKLGQSELYRNRENLNLQILHAFKIPNFIIQKMKIFFIDLNIKSRGLITNSYSSIVGGSHLRNALLQGSQNVKNITNGNSNNVNLNSTEVNINHTNGNNGNSNSVVTLMTAQTITTTTPTTTNIVNETNTISTITADRPKPKSTLSSSHATLTALLTNNSENTQSSAENG